LNSLIPFLPREQTDPLWRRLDNARLFITGGSGLFGHWWLESLQEVNQRLKLNISAVVLTRNPAAIAEKFKSSGNITFIQGDVTQLALKPERFDYVLHMATTSAQETYQGFSQVSKLDMLYLGTHHVLEYAQQCGALRVLFTSSGAVYGQGHQTAVTEDVVSLFNPRQADSSLTLGKLVAEFLCTQYAKNFPQSVVIARCFSFIGPGLPLDIHYAVGNFIRDVLAGQPVVIKGDGSPVRTYLYLGDLLVWLLTLLLDGQSGEVYNIGSDESVSILELAEKVVQLSAQPVPIHVQQKVDYSVGVPVKNYYVPSIDKIKHDLGVNILTHLDEAIIKTINYYRSTS